VTRRRWWWVGGGLAVFALVILYLLHSVALLLLPRMNPALFAQVTTRIPLWLQRAMAVLSILSMAAILTQLTMPTVQLLAFWAAIGALLYISGRIAHRRTAGRVEHAEEA